MVGNLVHDNNETDNPAIDVALLAQGNGILVAGAVRNVVERNRVWNHDRTGIGLVPFPEEDANDLAPPASEWDTPCEETHDEEVPPIADEDCKAVDGLLAGLRRSSGTPSRTGSIGNVVEDSGVADIAVGTVDLLGTGETTDTLRQLLLGQHVRDHGADRPRGARPVRRRPGNGGDWNAGRARPDRPARLAGRRAAGGRLQDHTRSRDDQPNMPDAATAPGPPRHRRARRRSTSTSITVPEKPADSEGRATWVARRRASPRWCRPGRPAPTGPTRWRRT